MPHNAPVAQRVAELNERYKHHSATTVLEHALKDPQVGQIALVSSFGAESVVLLHMLSVMNRKTPVLFVDTEMLFEETIQYQLDLIERLELTDVRRITADAARIAAVDPDGTLHQRDTDACCNLRKTEVLQAALAPFDSWVTGRKRFQGATRAALNFFENEADMRIKVNPLAHWAPQDVQDYILNNRLPRHPLVAQGYPSIGCAPCTSPVKPGEDPRAGRWRGSQKEECGIHFVNGKLVRGPLPPADADVSAEIAPNPTPTPVAKPEETQTMTNTIVTDAGFNADDWTQGFVSLDDLDSAAAVQALDLPSDADPAALTGKLDGIDMIRVDFPSFADGRGFTIARRLRLMGFEGRLRAKGHVIADQYAMARRSGFDEVEIDAVLATRQPQDQWLRRANWQAHDYQSRLRAS